MNPAPESEDWLDAVQGRRLSPEEEARLRRLLTSRPRELHRLDEELLLNRAIDALPSPKVSSNFLARVEARISDEERASARSSPAGWNWLRQFRLLRPLATVAVAVLALGGWWQFQTHRRANLATSLAVVSQAAGMPGVESLRDFDAVQLLRTTALPGDVELLAALDADPAVNTP